MQECSLMRILQVSQPPALVSPNRTFINITFHIKLRDVMSISPGSSSFYFPLVFMLTEKISLSMKMIVHIKANLHYTFSLERTYVNCVYCGKVGLTESSSCIQQSTFMGYFPLSRFQIGSVCRVRISAYLMVLLLSV